MSSQAINALATADPAYGPTKDNVAITAPLFANEQDKGTAYPFDDASNSPGSNALAWYDTEWAYGRNNMYPYGSNNISTFHVLDEIVAYYKDQNQFPNMHEIVVAGHSMGSQLIQRYAALTSVGSDDRVQVTFWPGKQFPTCAGKNTIADHLRTGDPNSLVWLSTDRPQGPYVDCDTYDNYPEGFSNYEADNQQYGVSLVMRGRDAIRQNYESKQISYLRSLQDTGDYTVDGCGAYSTGPNRDVRFLNFMNMFPPSCDNPSGGNCDTVDYVDESHDAAAACKSSPGMSRLFYDNFDGKGGRAHDFGARRTQGDSPYPA